MCGIAGLIKKNNEQVTASEIEKLCDVIAHRGPDGKGAYIDGKVGLGHRRLAILDLSEAGAQPMIYKDNLVIVFNGEIYNYIELRETLRGRYGHIFHTQTDTEVILTAYRQWGTDCVLHFNGMWSFAIYDKSKQILFCSRDRFGVKPFYFSAENNEFAFGSEIKQLLLRKKQSRLNHEVLLDFWIIGLLNNTENTFFQGISKLMPGHNLIYDVTKDTITINRYYQIQLHQEMAELSDIEVSEKLEDLLKSSINLRLRSDVKVGTCLSGGLDSSVIAAVASKEYAKTANQPFAAITARSYEPASDESDYAKMVADQYKLNWLLSSPTQQGLNDNLLQVTKVQEEPFGSLSILMQFFVMQMAKENNITVLLDGQGGDEILLGYERYYVPYLMNMGLIDRVRNYRLISQNSRLSLGSLMQYLIYFKSKGVQKRVLVSRLKGLKDEYKSIVIEKTLPKITGLDKNINRLQQQEVRATQLPALLNYEDKNSMFHSIETRLPFLDYRVMEFSLSLNPEQKIKNGWTKYPLRQVASRLLPEAVAWRKVKFGFQAPSLFKVLDEENMQRVIQDSPLINAYFGNNIPQVKRIHPISGWRLFNTALWEKVYNVGI